MPSPSSASQAERSQIASDADTLRAWCLATQAQLESRVLALPEAERRRFVAETGPLELEEVHVTKAAAVRCLSTTI